MQTVASPIALQIVALTPHVEVRDEALFAALGYGVRRPTQPRLLRLLQEIRAEVRAVARPRLLLGLGSEAQIREHFGGDRQVARYLAGACHGALMAGTAGLEVAELAVRRSAAGDPFAAYLVASVATVLARETLRAASHWLGERHPGLAVNTPLSPGNAGARMSLQTRLLEGLPLEQAGISFDAQSLLMRPAASVSAIFGVGEYAVPEGPVCRRCPAAACPLREASFEPKAGGAAPDEARPQQPQQESSSVRGAW